MGRQKEINHDAILADYLAGTSTTDIASKYGCPGYLGCQLAKRRGVSRSAKVVALVNKLRAELASESHANSSQGIKATNKRKRIVEYTKRHGLAAAAAKYGYSVGGLRLMAIQHGWNPSRKRIDQQALSRDYIAGMKVRDIAEKYGCNMAYASQLAKTAGIARQVRGSRSHAHEKPQRDAGVVCLIKLLNGIFAAIHYSP